MTRLQRPLLWLFLGVLAVETSAQPPWREATAPRQTRDEAAELLKAARLERETGHQEKALDLCAQILRRFPADQKSTPTALILGAEILLEKGRTREARSWTSDAITRFRDLPVYQDRMAMLHRRAIVGLTKTGYTLRWPSVVNYFLYLQWSMRGLSHEEVQERQQRFRAELSRHREDWERAGAEGDGPEAPSGMRRIMESLTASLAADMSRIHGQELPLLDEVAELFRERLELLQEIWSSPTPDPRIQERFDRLMESIESKLRQLQHQTFRQAALRDYRRATPPKPGEPGRRPPRPSSYQGMSKAALEKKASEIEAQLEALEGELSRIKAEIAKRRK